MNQETLPFVVGSDTSREAAQRMEQKPSKVKTDRGRILAHLAAHGPLTDRQMQGGLAMAGSTQRPRRGELAARGDIYKTGNRRDGCAVWAIARLED